MSSRRNVYEESDQELGISRNTGTIYLNNPSEEAIAGSNRIKEQKDSMKLQIKEVILKNV